MDSGRASVCGARGCALRSGAPNRRPPCGRTGKGSPTIGACGTLFLTAGAKEALLSLLTALTFSGLAGRVSTRTTSSCLRPRQTSRTCRPCRSPSMVADRCPFGPAHASLPRKLGLHVPPSRFPPRAGQVLEAVAGTPGTHSNGLRDRLDGGLPSHRFAPASRGSPPTATGRVWLRHGGVAHRAANAACEREHDPWHVLSSQTPIALDSWAAIMDRVTAALTMWADGTLTPGDHGHAPASIPPPLLRHTMTCGAVPWHPYPFDRGSRFCVFSALLTWQGLVLLSLACAFFPRSTSTKPFPPLFFRDRSSSFPRKDGDPSEKATFPRNEAPPATDPEVLRSSDPTRSQRVLVFRNA